MYRIMGAFNVQRSKFGVQRSAFNVRRRSQESFEIGVFIHRFNSEFPSEHAERSRSIAKSQEGETSSPKRAPAIGASENPFSQIARPGDTPHPIRPP
jgi:hypothetical protein